MSGLWKKKRRRILEINIDETFKHVNNFTLKILFSSFVQNRYKFVQKYIGVPKKIYPILK